MKIPTLLTTLLCFCSGNGTNLIAATVANADQPIFSEPGEAATHPHFSLVGEYVGQATDDQKWGLHVNSSHAGLYGMLYPGGLPGAGWDPESHSPIELKGDMRLHLEFRLPFMPGHKGQRRGNSGVYIMNRYEVQIIDWFARKVAFDGTGAVYRQKAPKVNMCFPPLSWQTYDIDFRAPRFDRDGQKTKNARITIHLNGVLIHDDYEMESGTGKGGERPEVAKAMLWLQNHTGPVRFRNVWLLEP